LSSLLGEKMGGSVMSKSLMGRLLKLPYGTADEMIREKLGEALLNPQVAAKYMQQQQTNKLGSLLQGASPYVYKAAPALSAQ